MYTHWYLIIRVFFSIAVLGVALYVIIRRDYSRDSKEWAFGVVGFVLGFWFQP